MPSYMTGTGVEQVTLTGNLPYTLPVGLAPNTAHHVEFTQDATGGHTVTYSGQPVAVDLAPGASTVVELHPVAGGYVVRYPAIGDAYASRLTLPTETGYSGEPIQHVTLVAGMEGEGAVGSGATISADTVTFESGGRAWKVTSNAGASESRLRVTPTDPLQFPPASAVCARVYIPDVSKITAITVDIFGDAALTFADRWSRSSNAQGQILVNGWNTLRVAANVGSRVAGKWGNAYRVDVIGSNPSALAGHEFIVDRVWVECRAKATLTFVEDHCSVNFLTYGYPGLKALGVPVYWALNPAKMGLAVVDQGIPMHRMTEAQIESVAWENRNMVGAHAWGDIETENMTPEQIRADVIRTTKWLQARGYNGWLFRPAWWRELATNYAAAKPLYLASSTYKADAGLSTWPPVDRYNIPRYNLYRGTRTTAQIDSVFQALKDTRQHINLFTHMVAPAEMCGTMDTDLVLWQYVLDKIAAGMAEGWLEPVSWLDLWTRSGGRFRHGLGGAVIAEYYDESGTYVSRTLP